MTTSDKGRGLPRVHALYGPTDPLKERKFRCCVQGELNDADFKQFTSEMLTFLQNTLSASHCNGTVEPGTHSTKVRFVLGKKHLDLGVASIDVTIADLKADPKEKRLTKLRAQFEAAIIAARQRVLGQRAEAA